MNYKIIASRWQTAGAFTSIGVVAIQTSQGWKCYIGLAVGDNEAADEQRIAANGSKLPKAVACAWFPELKAEEWES